MRGRRKTDDLEKTIPDLPENRRPSKPPANWRPVLRPSQPPPLQPLGKTVNPQDAKGEKDAEEKKPKEKPEQQKPKRKLPKQYLDMLLDNVVVQGKLERVKELVEFEGAVPTEKNVKTAKFVQENEIAEYLQSQIEKAKRIKDSIPPGPSKEIDDAWDGIDEKKNK